MADLAYYAAGGLLLSICIVYGSDLLPNELAVPMLDKMTEKMKALEEEAERHLSARDRKTSNQSSVPSSLSSRLSSTDSLNMTEEIIGVALLPGEEGEGEGEVQGLGSPAKEIKLEKSSPVSSTRKGGNKGNSSSSRNAVTENNLFSTSANIDTTSSTKGNAHARETLSKLFGLSHEDVIREARAILEKQNQAKASSSGGTSSHSSSSSSGGNEYRSQEHDGESTSIIKIIEWIIFLAIIALSVYTLNEYTDGDLGRVVAGFFPREMEALGLKDLLEKRGFSEMQQGLSAQAGVAAKSEL